jgi:hypothetical protein
MRSSESINPGFMTDCFEMLFPKSRIAYHHQAFDAVLLQNLRQMSASGDGQTYTALREQTPTGSYHIKFINAMRGKWGSKAHKNKTATATWNQWVAYKSKTTTPVRPSAHAL